MLFCLALYIKTYFMGKKSSKVSVATLNYSGIYLSPFEYYAVDNWEELEEIGRIFERNLKRDYQSIKDNLSNNNQPKKDEKQANKKEKEGAFEAPHYSRATFAWDVGDIDKYIHEERYSPLYSQKGKIDGCEYAGIYQDMFETKDQYIKRWKEEFKKLEVGKDAQVAKQAKKAKPEQRQQCALLDFMCYQAIVQYLYERFQRQDEENIRESNEKRETQQQKVQQLKQNSFDFRIINSGNYKHRDQLRSEYQRFITESFKRIDVQYKIKMTIDHLFMDNTIDVITLPQSTYELRQQIEKLDDYYVFGPSQQERKKQTLMIIRKKSILLPANYSHKPYLQSNQLLHKTRSAAADIFKSSETEDIKKGLKSLFQQSEFRRYLQANHISQFFDKYAKQIQNYKNKDKEEIKKEAKLQNDRKNIREIYENIMEKLQGSFKMRLEVEISNSSIWGSMIEQFFLFWQARCKKITEKNASKGKQYKNFIQDLKSKGLFCWMMDVTLAQFPDKKLVVGGFHLPSKAIKNEIVVSIMGIIVYFLKMGQYNFIFSGDFNSYLSLVDKEESNGIFHFIDSYLQKKGAAKFTAQILQYQKPEIDIYPKHPRLMTTKKKRTIMQPQVKKTNELKELCIDQIMSSFEFTHEKCTIGEIGEIGAKKMAAKHFLPHSKHPYDHFLVYSQLTFSEHSEN